MDGFFNSFKFRIIGSDLFIIGKKNEIQNTGMAMIYGGNGVFVEANEANMLSNNISMTSFPNPSSGLLTFKLDVERPVTLSLEIRDLLGKRVATVFDKQSVGFGTHEIGYDGTALAPGIYLYELRSANSRMVSKLVIAR